MRLKMQKRLASRILKCSKKNIWLDPTRLNEIKEAITKADIKSLINEKSIKRKRIKGNSRYRIREKKEQKRKRSRGFGSIKGSKYARFSKKSRWAEHIRVQRKLLQTLREKNIIDKQVYRSLYMKSKGGFFRSRVHLKIYMQERGIIKK